MDDWKYSPKERKERENVRKLRVILCWLLVVFPGAVGILVQCDLIEQLEYPGTAVAPIVCLLLWTYGFALRGLGYMDHEGDQKKAGLILIVCAVILFVLIRLFINPMIISNNAFSDIDRRGIGVLAALGVISVPIVCIFLHLAHVEKTDPERFARDWQGKREKKVIVKTKIVDSSHTSTAKAKAGSAIGRAVVGDILLGPIGMVAGAMTAKQKVTEHHTTTFLVFYEDGTQEWETVDNKSKKYREYMDHLEA